MKSTRILLAILICIGFGYSARAAAVSVSSYALDVTFQPAEAHMDGIAWIDFKSPIAADDSATFYLHGELHVDSVRAGGRTAKASQDQVFYYADYSLIATKVTVGPITAPANEIVVYYSGYFHPSNARSPSDYMRIDPDGVFLRAYGYSLWFPVFLGPREDAPRVNFTDVTIRTPEKYYSVFAGNRIAEDVGNGERTTRWQAPDLSLYAAQCTAQPFEVMTSGNVVLYHYADSESVAAAKAIANLTQELTGDYAKDYRHTASGGECYIMEMPRYGDISSGNVTGLMGSTWKQFMENENAQRALAHELVHPFVAVPVARDDSLWSLAIEGFPSYFHLPILAHYLGAEFYNRFMGWIESNYLEMRKTGVDRRGNALPPEKPLLAIGANEMSEYKDRFVIADRALFFLDWLRRKMGEERFFAFTSDMLNQPKLTTQSFRDLIEKYLPGSRADVHRWLETNDYPDSFHFVKE